MVEVSGKVCGASSVRGKVAKLVQAKAMGRPKPRKVTLSVGATVVRASNRFIGGHG